MKTACRLMSPRLCHRELVDAANRLLRVLLADSTHDYYARKDMVVISESDNCSLRCFYTPASGARHRKSASHRSVN